EEARLDRAISHGWPRALAEGGEIENETDDDQGEGDVGHAATVNGQSDAVTHARDCRAAHRLVATTIWSPVCDLRPTDTCESGSKGRRCQHSPARLPWSSATELPSTALSRSLLPSPAPP